jgi:aerobic-type carbon monoxide dehydrogenase small subunit (CoxS/CutS family)
MEFTFQVNGQARTVESDPNRPLLEVLREDLKLMGVKYGCGEGQCGACTVLVDGKRQHSCLTTAQDVAGKRVTTIEGLAQGDRCIPCKRLSWPRMPCNAAIAPPE